MYGHACGGHRRSVDPEGHTLRREPSGCGASAGPVVPPRAGTFTPRSQWIITVIALDRDPAETPRWGVFTLHDQCGRPLASDEREVTPLDARIND
ncbi:MAG: hypothetical protein OHK0015_14510 [Chloroflexi bacterium OHK40]